MTNEVDSDNDKNEIAKNIIVKEKIENKKVNN